ncbi:MAG TPA: O-antigen ligase family protein [Planctomycetota bacterium]|nr:O-antigen ligase family protein [Planctomycetota bacterium]
MIGLWIGFLAVWSGALLHYGAVSRPAVAATTAALALLYGASLVLLPDPPRLGRTAILVLGALASLLALQLLPLPWLYPHTARLRGEAWGPGTADLYLSLRTWGQICAAALAALLVLRLRQAGLTTSLVLKSAVAVLVVEAVWGFVRLFAGWAPPFYSGQTSGPDSAAGTLVNRNNFGGLMAMGLVMATALAASRITWPPRRRADDGPPSFPRRLEAGLGWGLAAALFAAALVASKSRGAALSAFAGLALLPALHRGRASTLGAAVLAATALVGVFAADPAGLADRFGALDPFELSSDSRWQIWRETVAATRAQPILGFGIGTHPVAFHPFQPPALAGQVHHAHNDYINLLFEAGVVGLLLALAGAVVLWRGAWRGLRPMHGPDRLVAAGGGAALAVAFAHALVDFDLRITAIALLFGALAGLAASWRREAKAPSGHAIAAWTVPAVGLALAGTLAFGRFESAALSPYDHEIAWRRAAEDPTPDRFAFAASLFPAHPELQRKAGLALWDLGDGRSAECFWRLFRQRPQDVESVLEEIYDPARPVDDYERLLPPVPRAAAGLAAFLVREGDWTTAARVFERGCPAVPEAVAAYDHFAGALHAAGQWGLEAKVRTARLALRTDAAGCAAAATAWVRLGAHDAALEHAQNAERMDPLNASWTALRADILAAKGDRRSAIEAMTQALSKAGALRFRERRAQWALAEEAWGLAEQDFAEILRLRPDDRPATLGLSRVLLATGRRERARVLLDAWLGRRPDDAEAKRLRESAR